MSKTYLELDTLIAGFRLCCQTEAKSNITIEWYVSALKRFRRYLTNNEMPTHLFSISRETIRAFIKYLQVEARVPKSGKHLSPSTVHAYVRTLKAFFSWIIREDYLEDNPMATIKLQSLNYIQSKRNIKKNINWKFIANEYAQLAETQ